MKVREVSIHTKSMKSTLEEHLVPPAGRMKNETQNKRKQPLPKRGTLRPTRGFIKVAVALAPLLEHEWKPLNLYIHMTPLQEFEYSRLLHSRRLMSMSSSSAIYREKQPPLLKGTNVTSSVTSTKAVGCCPLNAAA
jgi:hypothetical protein